MAVADFIAFAPDALTALGSYPADDELALFGKLDCARMTEDFLAAGNWLRAQPESTGKLGVIGFCFGSGVVNQLAVRMGSDLWAGVPSTELNRVLPTPQKSMRNTVNLTRGSLMGGPPSTSPNRSPGVPHEGHICKGANHGFHDDTTPRYDETAAKEAWQSTLDWFNKYLR